jgi:hypothetical protein
MPTAGEVMLEGGIESGRILTRATQPPAPLKVERGLWSRQDPAAGWLGAIAQAPAQRTAQPATAGKTVTARDVERAPVAEPSVSPTTIETMPLPEPVAAPAAGPGAATAPGAPVAPPAVTGDVALRLELNEIALLRDAAAKAGGRLEWSMKLVGVKAEDLLVPLANSGQVRVFQDPGRAGRWVIASPSKEEREARLRDELTQLESRRRALLEQIRSLEGLGTRTANSAPASR